MKVKELFKKAFSRSSKTEEVEVKEVISEKEKVAPLFKVITKIDYNSNVTKAPEFIILRRHPSCKIPESIETTDCVQEATKFYHNEEDLPALLSYARCVYKNSKLEVISVDRSVVGEEPKGVWS